MERSDFARQHGEFGRHLVRGAADPVKPFGDARNLRSAFFAVASE
jgi:hypothetical protein